MNVILRVFTDPRIEKLAKTDPLLAIAGRYLLYVAGAGDDTAVVETLVQLLGAYSEVTEAVREVKGLREGLQDTVFAKMEVPLDG